MDFHEFRRIVGGCIVDNRNAYSWILTVLNHGGQTLLQQIAGVVIQDNDIDAGG